MSRIRVLKRRDVKPEGLQEKVDNIKYQDSELSIERAAKSKRCQGKIGSKEWEDIRTGCQGKEVLRRKKRPNKEEATRKGRQEIVGHCRMSRERISERNIKFQMTSVAMAPKLSAKKHRLLL